MKTGKKIAAFNADFKTVEKNAKKKLIKMLQAKKRRNLQKRSEIFSGPLKTKQARL